MNRSSSPHNSSKSSQKSLFENITSTLTGIFNPTSVSINKSSLPMKSSSSKRVSFQNSYKSPYSLRSSLSEGRSPSIGSY